jgi:hypothetical protein
MPILDSKKVNTCLLLLSLFSFTFLSVDPTAMSSNVRAYQSHSAHSRSSNVGPPTTPADEEMRSDEDKEEDDSNELAPRGRQVSEVCFILFFFY